MCLILHSYRFGSNQFHYVISCHIYFHHVHRFDYLCTPHQPKGGVKIAADEAEAKKNGGAVAASLPENSDDLIPMIRDVCRVARKKKRGDLIDP